MHKLPILNGSKRQQYVRRILSRYCFIPSTLGLVRSADRAFANELFDKQVPMAAVEAAFALASLRRELRPPCASPLSPIRSLRYFRPIIDQMLDDPPHLSSLWPLALRLDELRMLDPSWLARESDLPPW